MIHWLAQISPALDDSPPPMADPIANYGSAIAHMLLTFLAVIILLFVSFWFLRRLIQNRLQKGSGEQAIHVLEKRMISPKTMLYWIEVDCKKILIAESHLEVRKIETFPLEGEN